MFNMLANLALAARQDGGSGLTGNRYLFTRAVGDAMAAARISGIQCVCLIGLSLRKAPWEGAFIQSLQSYKK